MEVCLQGSIGWRGGAQTHGWGRGKELRVWAELFLKTQDSPGRYVVVRCQLAGWVDLWVFPEVTPQPLVPRESESLGSVYVYSHRDLGLVTSESVQAFRAN